MTGTLGSKHELPRLLLQQGLLLFVFLTTLGFLSFGMSLPQGITVRPSHVSLGLPPSIALPSPVALPSSMLNDKSVKTRYEDSRFQASSIRFMT